MRTTAQKQKPPPLLTGVFIFGGGVYTYFERGLTALSGRIGFLRTKQARALKHHELQRGQRQDEDLFAALCVPEEASWQRVV